MLVFSYIQILEGCFIVEGCSKDSLLVRKMRVELTRYCYHRYLKPARLPFRHFCKEKCNFLHFDFSILYLFSLSVKKFWKVRKFLEPSAASTTVASARSASTATSTESASKTTAIFNSGANYG